MKQRNILMLQLLSFTVAGAHGAVMNFINLHLEQVVGLTGSEIGLVAMVSMILLIIINPIWGYLGDKTGKHILLFKLSFLTSILMAALYFSSRTLMSVLIVATLFEAARSAVIPFLDIITLNYCDKVKYDFGKVRVFSSIGFMVSTMTIGFMIAGLEFNVLGGTFGFEGFLDIQLAIFGTFIILMFVSFILAFFVPKPDAVEKKGDDGKKINKEDIKLLLTNRNYLFILVFIALSLVTLESAKMYLGNHMVIELGTGENIMSWLTLAMVGPELILVPLGSTVIRKFGFKKWYIFAVSTMIVRLAIYSFATNIALIIIVSLVHGVGIMTHISGNMVYIRKVVPHKVMGLAFMVMVSFMALCRAVLSLAFGYIYEHMNGFMVFRVTTVILIGGLIWVINSKCLKEVGDEMTSAS